MTAFDHEPVLLSQVVRALAPQDGQVFVDCTVGGGGHTRALLEAARCRVIGMDRDPAALNAARVHCAPMLDRLTLVRGTFDDVEQRLLDLGEGPVRGVLADLGVSSHQLDTAQRGFSFQRSGPIDMRMDPSAAQSAHDIVNRWGEAELADVIYRYGEERRSRAVAAAIVAGRPWNDTRELAAAVARAVGGPRGRIHPATRTFQALRIATNDELGQLERLLPVAFDRLEPGGRLAVITFHSLEDRIVKRWFAHAAGRNRPKDAYGNPIGPVLGQLRRPVTPQADDPNPRARSARLRVLERCA